MSISRAAQNITSALSKSYLLIGQCVPTVKENVSKIKVKRLELDVNLNMYFKTIDYYHAVDPGKKCKMGDIVLIQELPEKITKLITHKVVEIIHPFGDITDPITGKKVVVSKYRDEIELDMERFGKVDSAFDYNKAPPRGRLEGTRDITDKAVYRKFHEFEKEDPYAY